MQRESNLNFRQGSDCNIEVADSTSSYFISNLPFSFLTSYQGNGFNTSVALFAGFILLFVLLKQLRGRKQPTKRKIASLSRRKSQSFADIVYISAIYPSHAYPMLGYFSELEAQGFTFDVYGPNNVAKLFSQGDRNCFEFPELHHNDSPTGIMKSLCAGLLETYPAIEAMWAEINYRPKLIITDYSTTYASYLSKKLQIPLLVYYPFYFTNDPKRFIYNELEKGYSKMIAVSAIIKLLEVFLKYGVFLTCCERINIRGDQNISSTPKFIGDMIFNPNKANYHYIGPGFRDVKTVLNSETQFNYSLLKGPLVIFVSLGTLFLNSVHPNQYKNIAEAFRDSEETVIIAAPKEVIQALSRKKYKSSRNVHFESWVPQLEVLAHSKLFITHAGTGGYLEGLAAGVPMLCLPNYAEQGINSRVAVDLNIGRWLDQKDRSPAKIRKLAEEIIADKTIKESCEKYAAMINKTESRRKFTEVVKSMLNSELK